MPAWESFPVSVVYKAGEDSPLLQTDSTYRGTLRKERVPPKKQEWRQGYAVAKSNALTPVGKDAWRSGKFERDAWEDKKVPVNSFFTPDDKEEKQVWSPGSGRGKPQDKIGNTRGLRGGRKPSTAKKPFPLENAAKDEDKRSHLSPQLQAAKVFADLCNKDKARTPARGFDLSKSPKRDKRADETSSTTSSPKRGPATPKEDGPIGEKFVPVLVPDSIKHHDALDHAPVEYVQPEELDGPIRETEQEAEHEDTKEDVQQEDTHAPASDSQQENHTAAAKQEESSCLDAVTMKEAEEALTMNAADTF